MFVSKDFDRTCGDEYVVDNWCSSAQKTSIPLDGSNEGNVNEFADGSETDYRPGSLKVGYITPEYPVDQSRKTSDPKCRSRVSSSDSNKSNTSMHLEQMNRSPYSDKSNPLNQSQYSPMTPVSPIFHPRTNSDPEKPWGQNGCSPNPRAMFYQEHMRLRMSGIRPPLMQTFLPHVVSSYPRYPEPIDQMSEAMRNVIITPQPPHQIYPPDSPPIHEEPARELSSDLKTNLFCLLRSFLDSTCFLYNAQIT